MESKKLIDYGTLEWFDCKNNFPPMHIDLYVDSEHGYGIGRLGKRVKDGSTIWVVHLDSGEVYLVYAFYKVKHWAYMPKEEKKSELKAETIVHQGTTITLQMYPKSEADKVLANNKYKRCLAMAELCNEKWLVHNFEKIPTKLGFYGKWHKRWLELAEKFKEAK
jgi:hypothetical protein